MKTTDKETIEVGQYIKFMLPMRSGKVLQHTRLVLDIYVSDFETAYRVVAYGRALNIPHEHVDGVLDLIYPPASYNEGKRGNNWYMYAYEERHGYTD